MLAAALEFQEHLREFSRVSALLAEKLDRFRQLAEESRPPEGVFPLTWFAFWGPPPRVLGYSYVACEQGWELLPT